MLFSISFLKVPNRYAMHYALPHLAEIKLNVPPLGGQCKNKKSDAPAHVI
jgi:hypothetical protein